MLSCLLGIQDFENKTNKKIKIKKNPKGKTFVREGLWVVPT
jgi:hypothetical protein